MKTMSKKIGVLALAVTVSAAAMAGSRYAGDGHVTINKNADGSGLAVAYLGAIYNGDGATEWFGCQKSAKDRVFCHARTEGGVQVSCSVTSSYVATAVASMSPDARVIFTWNAKGTCTGVSVQHSSEYQDKQG
jgi:hypothetical protein